MSESSERFREVQPETQLSSFSSEGATATTWAKALDELQVASVFWLSTVRPDGRPHVTPLLAVWLGNALYFCTGPSERKAKNLAHNPHCILTTGRNTLDGLDIALEGSALEVRDTGELGLVADAYAAKYQQPVTRPSGTWFGLDDAIRSGGSLVTASHPSPASVSPRVSPSARHDGVSSNSVVSRRRRQVRRVSAATPGSLPHDRSASPEVGQR